MREMTCRIGERLRIGDDITARVLDVCDGQVEIGIEAPPDSGVYREEIYRRMQAERLMLRRRLGLPESL